MKQQAIQYVGLDVHQATLVVSVRGAQGTVVMHATLSTEAKAIVGLIRGLGGRVQRLRWRLYPSTNAPPLPTSGSAAEAPQGSRSCVHA